jgi:hypothetical protein
MEGMNPFWVTVIVIATFAGPAFLVLTIVAAIVWLVVRSRAMRIVSFALLSCTIFTGAAWLAAMFLIGSPWP